MGTGFQTELKSALDEPMREMRETAKMVRDAADPSKIASEAEAERRLIDEAAESAPPASNDSDTPAPAFEGVSDTGSDIVATPGQAPDDERTPDDKSIGAASADSGSDDEPDEAGLP